jgi:hypothetical protein
MTETINFNDQFDSRCQEVCNVPVNRNLTFERNPKLLARKHAPQLRFSFCWFVANGMGALFKE